MCYDLIVITEATLEQIGVDLLHMQCQVWMSMLFFNYTPVSEKYTIHVALQLILGYLMDCIESFKTIL